MRSRRQRHAVLSIVVRRRGHRSNLNVQSRSQTSISIFRALTAWLACYRHWMRFLTAQLQSIAMASAGLTGVWLPPLPSFWKGNPAEGKPFNSLTCIQVSQVFLLGMDFSSDRPHN